MTSDWTQEPEAAAALRDRDLRATFDPEALAAAVWDVEQAAEALDKAALGLSASGMDWRDLVTLTDALRRAREQAHRVESSIETKAAQGMIAADVKATEVEGVGKVEWRRARDRKRWDHQGLTQAVLDAHLQAAGGEVPDPWTVQGWFTDAAHIDYWKVRTLRALDIPVDEFCDSQPGRVSLDITRPG